jgi:hypothetical protein
MAGFVDAQNVVLKRMHFQFLEMLNEGVSEMRTESFGHGGLKRSFSLVKRDLDLQKILKSTPLPEKRATKKKVTIVTMKEEDKEGV